MIKRFYSGSVKDLWGTFKTDQGPAIVFKYTDAYSVFDWGRMPDSLPKKGQALTALAAYFFEKLENPEAWKEFSKSKTAHDLRRGNKADFIDVGEGLQKHGLKTHYLGVIAPSEFNEERSQETIHPLKFLGMKNFDYSLMAVRPVTVIPPVNGDYSQNKTSRETRLIPLEVVFRFSVPPGSSYLERSQDKNIQVGTQFATPVIETFTKLEPSDRFVPETEALDISGLSREQFVKMTTLTSWVGGFLKHEFLKHGLNLADGKLEWAVTDEGKIILVDAIGPDELRILSGDIQLSKEFLREHYRKSAWFAATVRAKAEAKSKKILEWKPFCIEKPHTLPKEMLDLATRLYPVLSEVITGTEIDPLAGSLPSWIDRFNSRINLKSSGGKKVLVVGSGAREHVIAWKLSQSTQVAKVIMAAGNDFMPFERWRETGIALARRAKDEGIDLVVIGPDQALADGLADFFSQQNVPVFGPKKAAAQLEWSKAFSKNIMREANVPTARYRVVSQLSEAKKIIDNEEWAGFVVKIDGLALGKGVIVCDSKKHAMESVEKLLPLSNGKLVIEEKLVGEEISWMAICDGDDFRLLDPARDFKRIGEGNTGPNTGGMGSICPVAEVSEDQAFRTQVSKEVFAPILSLMKSKGTTFVGVLYAGLMWNRDTKKYWVLEFNARFGDPEAQVVLPRIEGDLYPWLEACAKGRLREMPAEIPFSKLFATYVVAASSGYPDSPTLGDEITGLDFWSAPMRDNVWPYGFVAGVKKSENGKWITSGGRVLGALGLSNSPTFSKTEAYIRLSKIDFAGKQFRRDIGW
ncbi:MAG: phosphoribosylamine--glycine ligase [Xanthomonadaceae bacterium]|nr:phosphoribosylamine--glycine ligase [Xanthomonadaceae bacterium]